MRYLLISLSLLVIVGAQAAGPADDYWQKQFTAEKRQILDELEERLLRLAARRSCILSAREMRELFRCQPRPAE